MTLVKDMTVSDAAKAIADDIRTLGHYTGGHSSSTEGAFNGGCCLVLNRTYPSLPPSIQLELLKAIEDRVKMTAQWDSSARYSTRAKAVLWNDTAGTERVLEILDAIAVSGATA